MQLFQDTNNIHSLMFFVYSGTSNKILFLAKAAYFGYTYRNKNCSTELI